jgi:hypothetical protein
MNSETPITPPSEAAPVVETAAFPRLLVPAGMKDEIDFAAMGITMFEANAGEAQMPKEWLTQGRYDIGKDRA